MPRTYNKQKLPYENKQDVCRNKRNAHLLSHDQWQPALEGRKGGSDFRVES